MILGKTLLIAGGVVGMASAGTLFKPGVQFFEFAKYQGGSKIIVPEDGVCNSLIDFPYQSGSMKMLSGGMECALYSRYDCTDWKYAPKSRFRHGPVDNTDKKLSSWLNYHALDDMDLVTLQGTVPVQAFICRSFVNNLLQPDSSSNNKHVSNDGWHEPGEHYGNL